jgi:hypothetical protein
MTDLVAGEPWPASDARFTMPRRLIGATARGRELARYGVIGLKLAESLRERNARAFVVVLPNGKPLYGVRLDVVSSDSARICSGGWRAEGPPSRADGRVIRCAICSVWLAASGSRAPARAVQGPQGKANPCTVCGRSVPARRRRVYRARRR